MGFSFLKVRYKTGAKRGYSPASIRAK